MNGDTTRDAIERPRAGRQSASPVSGPRGASVSDGRVRRRGPLRVLGAVVAVPAIIGTVAIPAYAMMPSSDEYASSASYSLTQSQAQDLIVPGLVNKAGVAADSYAVTTKEEIDRQARDAAAAEQAAWSAELASRTPNGNYAVYTVKAEGDDYPWWDQLPDDYGGGLSPLRYYYRECVDFVAWRLNRDAGVTSAPWKWDWSNLASGSAYAWADAWAEKGWPTSSTPVVGAVAWFPYNHVAYVQSINGDGSVNLEEYNQNSDHSYHRRTIPAGEALYLYPPA
ncbi:CHAP domain-containing protein [Agromyces mediolanus]|uniref:CHAP domain-containing protein n=1 Tax=Agromyces mediolanus TaxID=41986 RepID=UPI00203CF09A|nr:CHAP domain-containing protein [Agromyces mediolanus]MCM3655855.1 CHAP domain-containing protein [Agromyces mediolanus]